MTQISDAESRIMEALWRKSPLTAEQIFAAVGPENGWAPATVKTLVTRLLKKNAVEKRAPSEQDTPLASAVLSPKFLQGLFSQISSE